MEKSKISLKLKKVIYFGLFLFAFFCVGFVKGESTVGALDVSISDTIDYSNNTVDFNVTWGVTTASNISYCFNDCSSSTDVSVNSYKSKTTSGGDTIATYSIDISSLDAAKTDTSFSDTKGRSFSVKVMAKAKTAWGLITVANVEKEKSFTYAPGAQRITKVTVGSTKDMLKIGDQVTFSIHLDRQVYVGSGVSVSFNLSEYNGSISASCNTSTSSAVSSIACTYTVLEGHKGTVSNVTVTGVENIKGLYGQRVGSGSVSTVEGNNISVDGVKPYITNITVSEGSFSTDSYIYATVYFSERMSFESGYVAPTLKFKFSDDSDDKIISCQFVSGDDDVVNYRCVPVSGSHGFLTFVSIDGGSKITDEYGNNPVLSYSDKNYYNTIFDNGLPNLSVTSSVEGCETYDGKTYCRTGSKIVVDFTFNMGVTFNKKNYSITFDGNASNGSLNETGLTNGFRLEYVVSFVDNGKMAVSYDLSVLGVNGKSANSTFTREFDYYVDNSKPYFDGVEKYYNDELNSSNTIYGANKGVVKFKLNVVDSSDVVLDASKISLIAHDDTKINVCDVCDFSSLTTELNGKELIVSFVINVSESVSKFKLKVEKDAIKDYFNNTLESDFVSGELTIDTKAPVFDLVVYYPDYKGIVKGNEWTLISGSSISLKITSDDVDLKEYCISSSNDCSEFASLELNKIYTEEILSTKEGMNKFYITVKDVAGNITKKEASFELKEIFKYSNGAGTTAKNHTIDVDVSVFDQGDSFKYAWFKKGNVISFNNANLTVKEDDVIVVEGSNSYNGQYNLCINRVKDGVILCSEYVTFDNKIDNFSVDVSTNWSNGGVISNVVFNDSSAIKCVAISKNYSSLNCESKNESVVIYKTSQAISPLTKYVISENATYYFYIEDLVGNIKLESVVFDKLDAESIKIEVFNGAYVGEYNSNLELENYKSEHTFKFTFDRGVNLGSNHSLYKYFFTTSSYNIGNIDDFNAYYLKNSNREEIVNPKNKELNIVTPSQCGIYNLYVLAVDAANNVSISKVETIKVDNIGPSIKKYDASNKETTSVGSSSFIVTFDYSFVIEDYESKLDLNNVYYNWVDSDNNRVFASNKKYDRCSFDYNTCRINGEYIEFGAGLFDPVKTYRFELIVSDNAKNVSKFTSSTFKIDTTAPIIGSSINEDVWYNTNDFEFSVSKENNVGTLDGMAYCVNDCLNGEEYNKDNFISLSVSNPTKEVKRMSLSLNEGENNIYIYARDVFGNYKYVKYTVKYDKSVANLVVNNLEKDSVNLENSENKAIDFSVSDAVSGLYSYCVYLSEANKDCYELGGIQNKNIKYAVSENGTYYIEVKDVANNVKVYNVVVEGIDVEPIAFDLVSSIREGKFTNGSVTITVSNLHDSVSDDCTDEVKSIDYVSVAYGSSINDYDALFIESVISVYSGSGEFTNSFSVSENKTYVVRVIDTANNVSYRYINVNGIDKDNPIVDTNTYGNGSDRIALYGKNGNVSKNGATGKYEYSNDTVIVRVGEDSLKDRYTGYNGQLSLKICFKYEDGNCDYETYLLKTKLNSNKDYLINNSLEITAPYDFSGQILYYVEDGAGNVSDTKVINVEYTLNVNSPVVSYSVKNNGVYSSYKTIYNEAYISGSTKLRITDIDLDYFEIYYNSSLKTRCYVNDSLNDIDCIKNAEGEIGFKLESGVVHYYLDSGNYTVKAYDLESNVKEIAVIYDNGNPEIEAYKKVGESYNIQVVGVQNVFNSIDDLYVKVNENNFSYMNIDLYNSKNHTMLSSVVRYSYMSELGKCIYDSSVCVNGASLSELLTVDTKGYNQIVVTVYDKANNYSEIVIAFDNEVPVISLKNVGDTIYVNGIVYTIKENNTIDVQIGANNRITLDNLLKEVIIDVDGYNYNQVSIKDLFTVNIYKNSSLFNGNMFDEIGQYEVVINYIDESNNVAEPKSIIVNVNDEVNPVIENLNSSDKVEIKESVVLEGILVRDNYGLELDGSTLVKEKILNIEDMTSCNLVTNSGSESCNISKVGDKTYKFTVAGTYTLVYTVSDISGNVSTYTQIIYVNDNKGPVMSAVGESKVTVQVLNRNLNGSVNVSEVSVSYPTSLDVGDGNGKSVSYVGLFAINNMGEKYKIINDIYKVSDEDEVVTYKFDKVGIYYLRFSSMDNSNNVSIFEYEVVVEDNVAPSIVSDLTDGQIVTIKLEEKFDPRSIIEQYNFVARDNYDEEVVLLHEVTINENNMYVITVKAVDSSDNAVTSVFYVNIIDDEAPIVGELVIDASTSSNVVKFKVVGGEDNSNNFYHEYKVHGGNWNKYTENSEIVFGNDFSSTVSVCIRAKDYSNNVSEQACKDILVDTKKPSISGVNDGVIYDSAVSVNISDDRLESVVILFDDEEYTYESLPVSLDKVGKYSIIAKDSLGNESVVNFIINIDLYMDVVNDFNAENYTITSVEFDKRLLVKSDITYNTSGDSMITVKLDGISIKDTDMLYILGVVPYSDNTFVMFSTSGETYDKYKNGITLVGYGSSFKEGVNNEDCLLKLNNDYYAYLIIKSDVENVPVLAEKENENKDSSGSFKVGLIVLGSLATVILGYQIIKLRRRVRAA